MPHAPRAVGSIRKVAVIVTVTATTSLGLFIASAGASQAWSTSTQLNTSGGQQILAVTCNSSANLCTAVDQSGREVTFNPNSPGTPTSYAIGMGNPLGGIVCNSGWTVCLATDRGGNLITFDPTSPPTSENFYPIDDNGGGLQGLACDVSFDICVAVDNNGNEITFNPADLAGRSTAQIDTTNLRGVSCPAASLCIAVDNNGNEVTFNPNSPGTPTAYSVSLPQNVSALACTGTAQCTAVDFGGNEVTFNPNGGSAPTSISTGSPNSGAGGLNAVACSSATQCTASGGGDQVTFNPTNGTVVTHGGPHPIDVSGGGLNALACPTTSQCTAVDNNGNEVNFNPTPSSGSGVTENVLVDGPGQLTALSCVSTAQCTTVDAVGEEITYNPENPDSPISLNRSLDSTGNGLRGVACLSTGLSTSQCTAVDNNGNEVTFNPLSGVVITDGGPTSVDSGQNLTSVACTSATECTAVDFNGNEVTFNPQSGAVTADGGPSAIDPGQALTSISCPSAAVCVAVDISGNEVTFDPTTGASSGQNEIDFNGFGGFNGVSCPSTSQCTGVDGNGNEVTFDPQDLSQLLDSTQIYNFGGLTAVSCPSTGYCVAATNSGGEVVEIDLETSPVSTLEDQLVGAANLRAIDCASLLECVAVDQVSQVFVSSLNEATASTPTNFGTQALDTAGPAQVVTVTNPTSSSVALALSIGGANPDDFLITSSETCLASLAPGASCTADVRFWPSASGARTATLQNTDVFSGATYELTPLGGMGGTTTQGAPTSATVTVAESLAFTGQLSVANSHGAVTYTQSTGSASLTASTSGLVSTTGTLAVGVYTATGTTADLAGEDGTFSFALTVTGVAVIQSAPTTGSATVGHSSSYSIQLTATGGVGALTFTRESGSMGLAVSASGLVTTTGTLHAGSLYEIRGTISDTHGETGQFAFRLTVSGTKITQVGATSGSTTVARSATYSHQLTATGNIGRLYFNKSLAASRLRVSSMGLVTTSGVLPAGSYSVSGKMGDAYGDNGTFKYTLVVRK